VAEKRVTVGVVAVLVRTAVSDGIRHPAKDGFFSAGRWLKADKS
jgi:hypothetical protein